MEVSGLGKTTALRLISVSLPLGILLTGCSTVASLAGVELKPVYSQQQKDAFIASFTISFKTITNQSEPLPPDVKAAMLQTGEITCAVLGESGKTRAKDLLVRSFAESLTNNPNAQLERLAEAIYLASTAQGSLCQEYR